jgi:predicted phage tail component-like protein
MSGFTYNGTHCSTYNVDYIPDADDRWFAGTDFEVYDKDISWKNGGYYYGNKAKKRVFSIKCYFEEITIKQREDIRKWLHRNTRGSLIFDDKPFVYWNVIPTKLISGKIYNDNGKYSGTFTVEMTAYEPFGYLTRKYNSAGDDDNAGDYCDLIPEGEMPAAPTTGGSRFNVYNPGREVCGMTIRLRGTTQKPVMFINDNNKTSCVVRDLPTNNLTLDIDGDTGMVKVYQGTLSNVYDNGFAYHDRGFVRLNPGMNTINVLEQNSSGEWSARSTLSLTFIEIDYKPRIL